MVTYQKCSDVPLSQIFGAFNAGFADYIVQNRLTEAAFAARFFGPEGNTPDLSYIAMDQEEPIGLILSGIRRFDWVKTMRCGTLCIAPAYRGRGISHTLFVMHQNAAIANQCQQLLLEVIKTNERALRFYEKYGYQRKYSLTYYSGKVENLSSSPNVPYPIRKISFTTLAALRNFLPDCHLNWQSDPPSYAGSEQEALLGMDDGVKLIALIAMSPQGKINFLWVDSGYRRQGLGRLMLQRAAQMQNADKLTVCLPNNIAIEAFLRQTGFMKEPIEQYEMYLQNIHSRKSGLLYVD